VVLSSEAVTRVGTLYVSTGFVVMLRQDVGKPVFRNLSIRQTWPCVAESYRVVVRNPFVFCEALLTW
jgi:hypothetical protein